MACWNRPFLCWVGHPLQLAEGTTAGVVRVPTTDPLSLEPRPLTVLVGGNDRGLDYAPLRDFLRDRRLTVIGLPDSGPRILAELADLPGIRTEHAEDLPAAVRLARKLTPPAGVVLLSPGAPSYGQYRNFEHRSEVFLQAIRDSA